MRNKICTAGGTTNAMSRTNLDGTMLGTIGCVKDALVRSICWILGAASFSMYPVLSTSNTKMITSTRLTDSILFKTLGRRLPTSLLPISYNFLSSGQWVVCFLMSRWWIADRQGGLYKRLYAKLKPVWKGFEFLGFGIIQQSSILVYVP